MNGNVIAGIKEQPLEYQLNILSQKELLCNVSNFVFFSSCEWSDENIIMSFPLILEDSLTKQRYRDVICCAKKQKVLIYASIYIH